MSFTDKFKQVFKEVQVLGLVTVKLDETQLLLNSAVDALTRGTSHNAICYIASYLAAKSEIDSYVAFSQALLHAQEQALGGKGMERHGGVDGGDWTKIAEHFPGFLPGQAMKKILEAPRLPPDRERAELLGAMVYSAFSIIWGQQWDT